MFERRIGPLALVIFSLLMTPGSVPAQETETGASRPAGIPGPESRRGPKASGPHKFWDGENALLFTGVAVGRALDFTSTQHFRKRGVNEVLLNNGIVDNKPLFAGIEAVGTAASIGLSYWLHRTGHHRAERWVSLVHIGVATFGDVRNYGLSNPQNVGILH